VRYADEGKYGGTYLKDLRFGKKKDNLIDMKEGGESMIASRFRGGGGACL